MVSYPLEIYEVVHNLISVRCLMKLIGKFGVPVIIISDHARTRVL